MHLITQTDPSSEYPGESWLWQNAREFRVVIDVGDHPQFAVRAADFEPDVLILTHDDQDHIGSALTFFERIADQMARPSTRTSCVARPVVKRKLEVWLPYDWFRLGLIASRIYIDTETNSSQDGSFNEERREVTPSTDVLTSLDQTIASADIKNPDSGVRDCASMQPFVTDISDGGLTLEEAMKNIEQFGQPGRSGSTGDISETDVVTQATSSQSSNHQVVLSRVHKWETGLAALDAETYRSLVDDSESEPSATSADRLSEELVDALTKLREGAAITRLAEIAADAVKKQRAPNKGAIRGRRKWVGSHREVGERIAGTAADISAIMLAAHDAGALFRFFDPDVALIHCKPTQGKRGSAPWLSEGIPGDATIVNAMQVRPQDMLNSYLADDLLEMAALTVQNRRALVTFLWPDAVIEAPVAFGHLAPSRLSACGGALIWSDSEHRVVGEKPTSTVVPWRYVSVMSAPHHASKVGEHDDIWTSRPDHVRVILSHNSQPNTQRFTNIRPVEGRICTKCAKENHLNEVAATSTMWPPEAELFNWWFHYFSETTLTGFCSVNHK